MAGTATGGFPIQIEIEFLTNAWHHGESHSAEYLPTRRVDNVAFDGRY
ncbi:MAG: hypothetical protein ACR2NS_03345 [Gemmatimonadaceae bacterium]